MPRVIKPQPGPQEAFLSSPADIVIFGGSAGCGKTFAELMDPIRYKNIKGFGCTIFRKNANQITQQGGLWDESLELYSQIKGALPRISDREWWFKDKKGNIVSRVSVKHIERDADVHSYQGGQICALFFDELCHFSEYTFFYMLSRNRSSCGVQPYVRATCNPDPDSWVARFISWWINQDTGYPIQERSGVIRYMVRIGNKITWGDSREELYEKCHLDTQEKREKVKSVTFIPALLKDNPALLKKDPGYRANLEALPEVEREQLLHGNWKIKKAAGLYFKRTQVKHYYAVVPDDITSIVRCWDLAATSEDEEGDPAYTAGVLLGKRKDGSFVVIDVINERLSASEVRNLVRLTAEKDRAAYPKLPVIVRLPKDPGQAGKDQALQYVQYLAGFNVKTVAETGSKEARATPFAAQWQAGNVGLVIANWNEDYLKQLESFPQMKFKDMVDASANGFNELTTVNQYNPYNLI